MSIECRECGRDLRGPHAKNCSRYQPDDDLEGDFEVSGTTMSEKHESENKPRIYVACSSREIERAERAIAVIRAAGGEVTFDWTVDVRRYGSQAPDVATGLRCAMADLEGVTTANVVLVLDGEYSYGRIVEHGAALALRKPVVVAGRPHGRIWETLEAARISGDDEAAILALSLARRLAEDGASPGSVFEECAELAREVASNDADFRACYRRHGDVLQQLAEVTAERDALKRRVEELEDALTITKTSQDHRLSRIRELEDEVRSLKTYDQFSDL